MLRTRRLLPCRHPKSAAKAAAAGAVRSLCLGGSEEGGQRRNALGFVFVAPDDAADRPGSALRRTAPRTAKNPTRKQRRTARVKAILAREMASRCQGPPTGAQRARRFIAAQRADAERTLLGFARARGETAVATAAQCLAGKIIGVLKDSERSWQREAGCIAEGKVTSQLASMRFPRRSPKGRRRREVAIADGAFPCVCVSVSASC